MRWLSCSYPELLALPDGYLGVAVEIAKKQAAEQRLRSRNRR